MTVRKHLSGDTDAVRLPQALGWFDVQSKLCPPLLRDDEIMKPRQSHCHIALCALWLCTYLRKVYCST